VLPTLQRVGVHQFGGLLRLSVADRLEDRLVVLLKMLDLGLRRLLPIARFADRDDNLNI